MLQAGWPDCGHRCGAYDVEAQRSRGAAADHHGATYFFVQLRQRDRPEHDLVGRLEPMARQDGRGDGRPGVCSDDGLILSVQLQVAEVGARPRGNVRVASKQVVDLLARDVA